MLQHQLPKDNQVTMKNNQITWRQWHNVEVSKWQSKWQLLSGAPPQWKVVLFVEDLKNCDNIELWDIDTSLLTWLFLSSLWLHLRLVLEKEFEFGLKYFSFECSMFRCALVL